MFSFLLYPTEKTMFILKLKQTFMSKSFDRMSLLTTKQMFEA